MLIFNPVGLQIRPNVFGGVEGVAFQWRILKRIANAPTQPDRIAKLRLSECSANLFEHCRA